MTDDWGNSGRYTAVGSFSALETEEDCRKDNWIVRFFRNELTAYIALILLTLFLTIIYLALQYTKETYDQRAVREFLDSFSVDLSEQSKQEVLDALLSQSSKIPWANAVSEDPVRYLDVTYDDDLLLRYFSPGQVLSFKQRLEDDLDGWREAALEKRKNAIDLAVAFASGRAANLNPPRPLNLRSIDRIQDPDYMSADIPEIKKWIKRTQETGGAPGADESQTQIDTERSAIINALSRVENEEVKILTHAKSRVLTMDHTLSFRWLHHEGGGWVYELVIWSWFGVIAHTFVVLMAATRRKALATTYTHDGKIAVETGGKYDPRLFLLIVPRLVLAPLIAIVVVAIVVSGITGLEITISNLPFFLAFSFVAGFASERFTGIIREFVNYLIPRLSISDEKVEAEFGEATRQKVFALNKNRPQTFHDFSAVIKDDVRSEIALAIRALNAETAPDSTNRTRGPA